MKSKIYKAIVVLFLLFGGFLGLWAAPQLAYGYEYGAARNCNLLALLCFFALFVWLVMELTWRIAGRRRQKRLAGQ